MSLNAAIEIADCFCIEKILNKGSLIIRRQQVYGGRALL